MRFFCCGIRPKWHRLQYGGFGFHIWGLYLNFTPGCFWLRFGQRGIHLKDTTRYPLIFSERYGYTKHLQLGKWSIKLLGSAP